MVSFISPEGDFFQFLQYFRYLQLLAPTGSGPSSPNAPIPEHSRFLVFLGENSKDELASCDVSFWTDVLLAQMFFRDGSSYVFSPGDDGLKILGSIYCGIHRAMKVSISLRLRGMHAKPKCSVKGTRTLRCPHPILSHGAHSEPRHPRRTVTQHASTGER